MALKLSNNYSTDFEDTGLFSGEGSVVADIFADIVPELAPMTTAAVAASTVAASQAPKTTQETIQSLTNSGALSSGNAVLVGDTYYQPVYASSGSGESFQQGPLENVITYKANENKVGGNVNWYTPSGTLTQTTKQQEVNPTKDFMEFASLAGSMFGVPSAIGQSLGLAGSAAQAVGQGLLTAGTQLGSGASLGDALTAGLKTGAVPITTAGLNQIPGFTSLSPAVQASVASAVGNTLVNGGQLTPGIALSSLAAGVQADKANIGALEGLTNSGRTGDDMGGVYAPNETPVSSMPSGTQVAGPMTLSVGGVPIYAESSNASTVKPPVGYEVMSSKLADAKPAGSYYDASINAWLTPNNSFTNAVSSNQILNDTGLFNSNVNTMDANSFKAVLDDSLSQLPKGLTLQDITNVIGQQNFATPQDIMTAINAINIPKGLTSNDVQSIVSNTLASNPSLTTDQVSKIVNNAVANIPAGLTATDVQSIVNSAVSKLPAAPTAQDIINIIGNQGLASTTQLTQQGKDLMAALQKQGVDYNTALSQALQSQNSLLGGQISNLSQQTQSQLAQQSAQTQQQFNTLTEAQKAQADALVKQGVSLNQAIAQSQAQTQQQISALSQQTQQQLAQQSALTQQQFAGLSDAQKAQADALVKQGANLNTAISQVQSNLGQQITNLSQQTQNQLSQQSAQTQQQFNSLTAAQKAQADALVSQGASFNTALNQVQAGLGQQIGSVQAGLESQLSAQGKQFMASLQQQGVDYQTALDQAVAQQNAKIGQTQSSVDTLAKDLGVTKEQLLSQLNTTEQALQSKLGGVQSSLEQQLAAQNEQLMASMQAQEDEYQKALQEAFAQQNTLTNDQLSNVINSTIGLFTSLGAQNAANRAANTVKYSPAMFGAMQPVPTYSPEYFNQVQQNYNQLLPAVPQDVASPLANWYNTQYGA